MSEAPQIRRERAKLLEPLLEEELRKGKITKSTLAQKDLEVLQGGDELVLNGLLGQAAPAVPEEQEHHLHHDHRIDRRSAVATRYLFPHEIQRSASPAACAADDPPGSAGDQARLTPQFVLPGMLSIMGPMP